MQRVGLFLLSLLSFCCLEIQAQAPLKAPDPGSPPQAGAVNPEPHPGAPNAQPPQALGQPQQVQPPVAAPPTLGAHQGVPEASGIPQGSLTSPGSIIDQQQQQQQTSAQSSSSNAEVTLGPISVTEDTSATTMHPCANHNISTCFHIIAEQINKTEELLRMANETLLGGIKVAMMGQEVPTVSESVPISARVEDEGKRNQGNKNNAAKRHKRETQFSPTFVFSRAKSSRVEGKPKKGINEVLKETEKEINEQVKKLAKNGGTTMTPPVTITSPKMPEDSKKKKNGPLKRGHKNLKGQKIKNRKKSRSKPKSIEESEESSEETVESSEESKESGTKKEVEPVTVAARTRDVPKRMENHQVLSQPMEPVLTPFPDRVVAMVKSVPSSDRVMGGPSDSAERTYIPKKHQYIREKRQAVPPSPIAGTADQFNNSAVVPLVTSPTLVTSSATAEISSIPTPATPAMGTLNFESKLESELSAAPKGLVLIVKEPGESNLIAGEQVDGNLNPISALAPTLTTATDNSNISNLNLMASKVGLMSNKMGTMMNDSSTLAPPTTVNNPPTIQQQTAVTPVISPEAQTAAAVAVDANLAGISNVPTTIAVMTAAPTTATPPVANLSNINQTSAVVTTA